MEGIPGFHERESWLVLGFLFGRSKPDISVTHHTNQESSFSGLLSSAFLNFSQVHPRWVEFNSQNSLFRGPLNLPPTPVFPNLLGMKLARQEVAWRRLLGQRSPGASQGFDGRLPMARYTQRKTCRIKPRVIGCGY